MSWATVVRDWNRSGKKIISDPDDVYALPLRGTEPYKVVRDIYDGKREKTKKKEVKMSEEEVLKPKTEKLKKFIKDIQEVRDDTIMIDKDKAKYLIESLKEELITTPTRLQRRGDYAYFWRRYDEFRNQIDDDLSRWTRGMTGGQFYGNESVYQFANKLDDFIRIASYRDDDDGNAYVLEKDIDKLDKLLNINLINKAIADKRTEKKEEKRLAIEDKPPTRLAIEDKPPTRLAIEDKPRKQVTPREEASDLIDNVYVQGYEFKDRKDMAKAVRALRTALPEMTSSVDALSKFFMKKGFTGSVYTAAFNKSASRPGKQFISDALNNRI